MEKCGRASRPQMTILHMRIACCIPKATNTHPQYIILIAFSLQQKLHQHPSTLRYSTLRVFFLLLNLVVYEVNPGL